MITFSQRAARSSAGSLSPCRIVAGAGDNDVRHRIPGVVDSDEQQTERRSSDYKLCELGSRAQEDCGQREGGANATRQYRVPKPILTHRLVKRLAMGAVDHNRAIGEPAKTAHRERD